MTDPREKDGAGPAVVNNGPVGVQVNPVGGQHTFNLYAPTPRPEPRKANLPPRPERFIGREAELAEIHALLLGGAQVALDQRAAKPGGLTGLGGVGKTTLACEYAHRHLDDYEFLCWVNAEGQDASSAFAGLAQDPLRLEGLPAEVPPRVVAVRQALERASGTVLLVFDNVDHSESWPDLVPVSPRVRVLVTTRLTDLDGVTRIDVDRLPPSQALELLLGSAEAAQTAPAGAAELCQELDHLTLALAVASKILAKGVRTPAALLAKVRRKGVVPFFDEKGTPKLLSKDSSLRRLFDTSVDLLDEADDVDAHARRMLWAGGWFAAAPIPRETLFDAATRLSGGPVPDEVDVVALERLVGLGLAQVAEGWQPSFHRVVAAYARTRGGVASSTAVLDALGAVASRTAFETMALRGLSPWAPHMAEAAARLDGESPEPHLWVGLRLAQHYRHMGRFIDGLAVCARLARLVGDVDWAWLFHQEEGEVLARQGNYAEALECYRRAQTILKDSPWVNDLDAAMTGLAIGQLLARQNRYAEALERYEFSIEILCNTLGTEDRNVAITLSAMGQMLADQGRRAEALDYYVRSLAIKEKTLGPDHPETAITLNGVGQVMAQQGKYSEALEYHERALAIQEKTLGPDHPETAITAFEFGRCLRDQGHPDGVCRMREAADCLERALGPAHPHVKVAREVLGHGR